MPWPLRLVGGCTHGGIGGENIGSLTQQIGRNRDGHIQGQVQLIQGECCGRLVRCAAEQHGLCMTHCQDLGAQWRQRGCGIGRVLFCNQHVFA